MFYSGCCAFMYRIEAACYINRVKLFTENSAMARLRDILAGQGKLTPEKYSNETHGAITGYVQLLL